MTESTLPLTVVDRADRRQSRDRLELLTALLNGPNVEAFYRDDIVRYPPEHRVFAWQCSVLSCDSPRTGRKDMCHQHIKEWAQLKVDGGSRFEFARTAGPSVTILAAEPTNCCICLHRPTTVHSKDLCDRHNNRWQIALRRNDVRPDPEAWRTGESPLPSYGECRVRVCSAFAASAMRLCPPHRDAYTRAGRPGAATLPPRWDHIERSGRAVKALYSDESLFRRWCSTGAAVNRPGRTNLRGLPPLVQAEVRYGLFAHTQRETHTIWDLRWIQAVVDTARESGITSLLDGDLGPSIHGTDMVLREMRRELQLIYFTPAETKDAGYIETEHFGVRFENRFSYFDLTAVSQRWLRDLLWDYLARLFRSPQGPRSSSPVDAARRACMELSAFLEITAPGSGHNPRLLTEDDMLRFVADQAKRARGNLPSLGIARGRGTERGTVSENTKRVLFNACRRILRGALDSGEADTLGLPREFIIAMPFGGSSSKKARNPFTDEVARALADEDNLRRLAKDYDDNDRGIRDAWETIIVTGRRCREVLDLRLECIGRYGGLALLWHDQTKVGNYDEAIRIPERIYELLQERQRKTLALFEDRFGRPATAQERPGLALFPSHIRNPHATRAFSYSWFNTCFGNWIDELDLGECVPHQARHTVATNLLRHGAGLHHIKKYLGQVSSRMAEHYTKVATSEIEDVLQHVWVAGPGAAAPGKLVASPAEGLSKAQAQAMAIDLSRRSTPAEGGFCTFQPVVDGGSCPWNLNCEGCDKFVISGADLLYWRRKREQWRSIAERAPDDKTADYLHQVFEPTSQAIDGLESALAGLGLLDDALALDLRRPQDYFQRIWNTAFRASDLAAAVSDADTESTDGTDTDQ
jgi:integrase